MADEVRTPRVFKVENQQEGRQDGQEVPSEAALRPQLDDAASDAFEVTQVRRRRRRLNGKVTIIRPVSHEQNAVRDGPSRAISKPDSIGDSQAQGSDVGRFDVDLKTQSRHESLLAQIALLERQAQAARKDEAAAAIRWIKKAISDYGIEARELGF